MERQHDHRHIQLEIAPPQPRQQELSLRRGGAALRREQLNQNRAISLPLLLRRLIDRGRFRRTVAVSRRASAETGEKTAPHYVVVSVTGKEGGLSEREIGCFSFFILYSGFRNEREKMGENEEQRNMKYVGGSERKVAEEAAFKHNR